jgi:plasmid stability protein
MRTTIRLDDALLRQAKARAAASGRSLNDFITDAVRAALAPRPAKGRGADLPTFRGRGLQPGVDLDDSAALLDLMERDEPDPGAAHPPRTHRAARVAEGARRRRTR